MSHPEYQATLDFLFSQLPMYQRQGAVAFKKDLSNTRALCRFLGNPERKFKSIHIAGTNGKGSVSHMLAAILQSAGYKTGLYTSPHLRDFRERIRINGQMIEEAQVVSITQRLKNTLVSLEPSFFELTVAMAFEYFATEQVDVAVIETGLGGRLDSTNVVVPELSVITNIGWDHMDLLGDTLEKIAGEKAGIIKADVPVVIGEYQEEVAHVFERQANEKRSLLRFASRSFQTIRLGEQNGLMQCDILKNGRPYLQAIETDQLGLYQLKNISSLMAAIDQLQRMGWPIDETQIAAGLKATTRLTGFSGRWTILGNAPLIVADTAHNEAGIAYLLEQLAEQQYENLHFVLSVVRDKDLSKLLSRLPQSATYYFCKASIPRGLDAQQLAQMAGNYSLKGNIYPSVGEAFEAAKATASIYDMILVGGSTFTVAEII
jgi:dihydrofolate synthase / folylpolyglutamate synthase